MSKLFGQYMREKKDVTELKEKVDANKIKVTELLDVQRESEEALITRAMAVPNLPDENVPDGQDEESNVELKKSFNASRIQLYSKRALGTRRTKRLDRL